MSATSGAGGRLSTRSFLESYRGARVFHPPLVDDKGVLVGNNGDRLMVMATDQLYGACGIARTDDARNADLVILGASGGLLDRFTHIPRMFRHLSQSYGDKPMCVLPSTFYYSRRPITEDIGTRRAPLVLFCREAYSYRHLLQDHKLPSFCKVFLDRDIAFDLETSPYVDGVRRKKGQHVLLVERVDVEHPQAFDGRNQLMTARKIIGSVLPTKLKRALYPLIRLTRSRSRTPFRKQCEVLLKEHHPTLVDAPTLVADISNVNTCTFDEFTEAIAHASVIFTTRLHVGILGAMAAKRTFIFEGPYHKIRGIYEHSLARYSHVTFVSTAMMTGE